MPGTMLDLQLSLLRGESPCPFDLTRLAGRNLLRLQAQTKSAVSDRLYVTLLGFIASGRLPPGARLPPERRIAQAACVSRVCVRTALDRLKADGYLRAVQGSGTHVVDEGHSTLTQLVEANAVNLADLADLCGAFEVWAIERAVLSAEDDELARLSGLLRDDSSFGRPPLQAAEAELALRLTLAEVSGSSTYATLMRHLVRGMRDHYFRAHRALAADLAGQRRLEGLRRSFAEALDARDSRSAKDAMAAYGRAMRLSSGMCRDMGGETGIDTDTGQEELLRDLAVTPPEQLRDRLAGEIAGMLASGRLRAGDKLPSERRLADFFGVSRISVREALAQLKRSGAVTASERSGTRAACHDAPVRLAAGLENLMLQNRENLRDLCAIRHVVEAFAARRAAANASPDDLADLRRILIEMRRGAQSARRRIELDLRLHLTIARAGGSAVQLYITEVLRDALAEYFDYSLSELYADHDRDRTLLDQHMAIVDALEARDPDRAELAMETHCRMFRDIYDAMFPLARAGVQVLH